MNKLLTQCLLALSVFTCLGCGTQSAPSTPAASVRRTPAVEGRQYLLDAEPQGAESILHVRDESKNGDSVVLVGRIGGDVNPWVEGRAAFSLVDLSAKACSDIPGDSCPTPWDYCCETDKLAKGKTLIKFVGGDGKPVAMDARQLLGVKELDTLVVQGTAQRDETGNLSILASKVFVRATSGPTASTGDHAHDHEHDHAHGSADEKPASTLEPSSSDAVPSAGETTPK